MERPTRTFILPALMVVACMVAVPTAEAARSSNVPSCVHAQAHARYLGFAWDHVVSVRNACEETVACTVSTSANASPIDFQVDPQQSRDVLTYRANVSREFTYKLSCSLSTQ